MKKRIISALALTIASLIIATNTAQAKPQPIDIPSTNPFEEQTRIRCTCYTDEGLTSTGKKTRHGIMAGNPDWYGCAVMCWTEDGEWLGYYEILDTGAGFDTDGDGVGDSIKNGYSVDVWCESDDEVAKWQSEVGDYIYIYLVRGVG